MTSSRRPKPESIFPRDKRYRDLLRRNLVRLFLTYLAPILLLTTYFYFQYRAINREYRLLLLKSIAEYQSKTLDLFLLERVTNLSNLIDDPHEVYPPTAEALGRLLGKLRRDCDAFVDAGFFDSTGVQHSYAGPLPFLEHQNYSGEAWFIALRNSAAQFVITDINPGLHKQPHFTIAVSRQMRGHYYILHASLDPERLQRYIIARDENRDVNISIVNKAGYYQLVTPHIGTLLEISSNIPPREPALGSHSITLPGGRIDYAYAWLHRAEWAVIAQWNSQNREPILSDAQVMIFAISITLAAIILTIIIFRAYRLVQMEQERDRARTELEHAAKLAAVGELAAGIAHEINNPLAIISEEVGLMKDLMDPQFGRALSQDQIVERLETIQDAVFRCRDITRKLLFFVRKSDISLEPHDPAALVDEVVVNLLGEEMRVSNIEIIRDYEPNLPTIKVDRRQFQQVLINLLNNAVDAIDGKGAIMVSVVRVGRDLEITITDTGCGMTPEQIGKIFLPFYTTKEVGKGTGLGLSVSYEIIKGMGGSISATSTPGKGSEFILKFPIKIE